MRKYSSVSIKVNPLKFQSPLFSSYKGLAGSCQNLNNGEVQAKVNSPIGRRFFVDIQLRRASRYAAQRRSDPLARATRPPSSPSLAHRNKAFD